MFPDHKTLGGRAGRPEDGVGDHLGDRLGRLLLLHLEGGQVDRKGCVIIMIMIFIITIMMILTIMVMMMIIKVMMMIIKVMMIMKIIIMVSATWTGSI